MPQRPGVIASMSETRHVHIFDATETFQSMLSTGPTLKTPTKPIYSFRGHNTEGFAIDWSNAIAGRLATGDCSGSIHVWNSSGNTWQVDSAPYKGHFGSVEDLQWSPSEATVFMSSSSDNTVKVWDIRGKNGPQISINAHSDDVNVISWNKSVSYLVASGCEDGSFKVSNFVFF
jgi:ribosome assembly protein RRB1